MADRHQQARRAHLVALVLVAAALVVAACSPTPGPGPSTTTTAPGGAPSLMVLTGTQRRTVLPAPGAAVVSEVQEVVGSTTGLDVQARPATDGTVGTEVVVQAVTAGPGTRTLQFRSTGCTVPLGEDGTCPAGADWSLVSPLVVTVAAPTADLPDGWSRPADAAWEAQPDGTSTLAGHLDVVLDATGYVPVEVDEVLAAAGAGIVGASLGLGILRVRVADPDAVAAALSALDEVASASPTVAEPATADDATPTDLTDLRTAGRAAYNYDQVDLPALWAVADPGARPRLGVIDMGVYVGHPDLGTGAAGRVASHSFVAPTASAAVQSENHGTHVAGTMCAADGNSGPVGAASNCELDVLDIGAALYTVADFAAFTDSWLRAYQPKVVNMSFRWGATGGNVVPCSNTYDVADRQLLSRLFDQHPATLFVIAAGNCGATRWGWNARASVTDGIPSANSRDNANVVSVSATTDAQGSTTRLLADFSAEDGDVAAPGVDISSALHLTQTCAWLFTGLKCALPPDVPGAPPRSGTESGTSMAAPLVAAMAGIVAAGRPALTGAELKQCLVDAATTEVTGIRGDVLGIDPAVKEVNAADLIPCLTPPDLRAQPDGRNAAGQPAPPNGETYAAQIAEDGSRVVLGTRATNLVPGTPPDAGSTVVIWDLATDSYVAPPPGNDGLLPRGMLLKSVSADGRLVGFSSCSTNLPAATTTPNGCSFYVWDVDAGTYMAPPSLPWELVSGGSMLLSADGTTAVLWFYNAPIRLLSGNSAAVWDLLAGTVSIPPPAAGKRPALAISPDGGQVLFSPVSDDEFGDPPASPPVLWDRVSGTTTVAPLQDYGQIYSPFGRTNPVPGSAHFAPDGRIVLGYGGTANVVLGECSPDPTQADCGVGEGPGQLDYSPVPGRVGAPLEVTIWSPPTGAFSFSPVGADGFGLRLPTAVGNLPGGTTVVDSLTLDGHYALLLSAATNALGGGRYQTPANNWFIWDRETDTYEGLPGEVSDAADAQGGSLTTRADRMAFTTTDRLVPRDPGSDRTAYVLFR